MIKLMKTVFYVWISIASMVLIAGFAVFTTNNLEKVVNTLGSVQQDVGSVQQEIIFLSENTDAAVNNTMVALAATNDVVAQTKQIAATAYKKPTLDNKISEVLTEHKDSVVFVNIGFKPEFEQRAKFAGIKGGAIGTGWFVKVDDDFAYVVTNHHVIEPYLKATPFLDLSILDVNTPWEHNAEIVGYDVISDLAVLKVNNYIGSGWEPLKWADHTKTKEGDSVVVIGHGLSLPWSMSSGIITAMDRWQIRRMNLMIQSDAVVNKGNSGGPMLNLDGEVVGVVDALLDPGGTINTDAAAYAGVSLIISGWQAEKAVNEIIETGKAHWPYFDFNMRNPDRDEFFKAFSDKSEGSWIIISEADKDKQSGQVGMQPGDYLVTANGEKLTGMISLVKIILSHKPGDTVEFGLWRDGEEIKVNYVLEDYTDY